METRKPHVWFLPLDGMIFTEDGRARPSTPPRSPSVGGCLTRRSRPVATYFLPDTIVLGTLAASQLFGGPPPRAPELGALPYRTDIRTLIKIVGRGFLPRFKVHGV